MKLLYRLLLMLCLLLPGMGAIGLSHAAHRSAPVASVHATDPAAAVSGTQARIQQLIIKSSNPGEDRQTSDPRAAIAEDSDSEDDDRDERSDVSSEVPIALSAFSFVAPVAVYCPEAAVCMPAISRPFLCPALGRRLALLSVFRI